MGKQTATLFSECSSCQENKLHYSQYTPVGHILYTSLSGAVKVFQALFTSALGAGIVPLILLCALSLHVTKVGKIPAC